MKITRVVGRIFEIIDDFLACFSGILVAFIGGAVLYEVVMRKIFRAPSLWVTEIVEYSMLYLTFLSADWLLRKEGHVTMDILINRLDSRHRSALTAIASVMCSIGCLIIAVFGVKTVVGCYQMDYTTPSELQVPEAAILWVIPFASVLFFTQFLRRASRSWRVFREGKRS
jgi:C4-dicarboxylate transporter DctQ subunit